MADIQVRGFYITFAIRKMHKRSGRRIAVLGHSQGGMAMRVALRFWPDTRRMVDDVIGMAGTNHGSDAIRDQNCAEGCSAAFMQQRAGARFVAALNSRAETFKRISYTEIYTNNDEVVTPPGEAASVSGPGQITNVAVQDICPANTSEHLTLGTTDPVAAALALDALGRRGPADPSRIDPETCTEPWMPGFDPITGPGLLADAAAQLADSTANFPQAETEPRIKCWAKLHPRRCYRLRRPH